MRTYCQKCRIDRWVVHNLEVKAEHKPWTTFPNQVLPQRSLCNACSPNGQSNKQWMCNQCANESLTPGFCLLHCPFHVLPTAREAQQSPLAGSQYASASIHVFGKKFHESQHQITPPELNNQRVAFWCHGHSKSIRYRCTHFNLAQYWKFPRMHYFYNRVSRAFGIRQHADCFSHSTNIHLGDMQSAIAFVFRNSCNHDKDIETTECGRFLTISLCWLQK